MRNHEQAVADAFNGFLRHAGRSRGIEVRDFSVGGQDRDAGADYLLSDSSRFALVEFKADEPSIHDEGKKPRRKALCQSLPRRRDMEQRHDQCHFIAWFDRQTQGVNTNIYRNEVCTCEIFGDTADLEKRAAEIGSRANARQFALGFLDPKAVPPRSLELREFEAYLAWLMRDVSGAATSTLELLASDPSKPEGLMLVVLNSVTEAYEWMQKNTMRDHPEDDPDDSPGASPSSFGPRM